MDSNTLQTDLLNHFYAAVHQIENENVRPHQPDCSDPPETKSREIDTDELSSHTEDFQMIPPDWGQIIERNYQKPKQRLKKKQKRLMTFEKRLQQRRKKLERKLRADIQSGIEWPEESMLPETDTEMDQKYSFHLWKDLYRHFKTESEKSFGMLRSNSDYDDYLWMKPEWKRLKTIACDDYRFYKLIDLRLNGEMDKIKQSYRKACSYVGVSPAAHGLIGTGSDEANPKKARISETAFNLNDSGLGIASVNVENYMESSFVSTADLNTSIDLIEEEEEDENDLVSARDLFRKQNKTKGNFIHYSTRNNRNVNEESEVNGRIIENDLQNAQNALQDSHPADSIGYKNIQSDTNPNLQSTNTINAMQNLNFGDVLNLPNNQSSNGEQAQNIESSHAEHIYIEDDEENIQSTSIAPEEIAINIIDDDESMPPQKIAETAANIVEHYQPLKSIQVQNLLSQGNIEIIDLIEESSPFMIEEDGGNKSPCFLGPLSSKKKFKTRSEINRCNLTIDLDCDDVSMNSPIIDLIDDEEMPNAGGQIVDLGVEERFDSPADLIICQETQFSTSNEPPGKISAAKNIEIDGAQTAETNVAKNQKINIPNNIVQRSIAQSGNTNVEIKVAQNEKVIAANPVEKTNLSRDAETNIVRTNQINILEEVNIPSHSKSAIVEIFSRITEEVATSVEEAKSDCAEGARVRENDRRNNAVLNETCKTTMMDGDTERGAEKSSVVQPDLPIEIADDNAMKQVEVQENDDRPSVAETTQSVPDSTIVEIVFDDDVPDIAMEIEMDTADSTQEGNKDGAVVLQTNNNAPMEIVENASDSEAGNGAAEPFSNIVIVTEDISITSSVPVLLAPTCEQTTVTVIDIQVIDDDEMSSSDEVTLIVDDDVENVITIEDNDIVAEDLINLDNAQSESVEVVPDSDIAATTINEGVKIAGWILDELIEDAVGIGDTEQNINERNRIDLIENAETTKYLEDDVVENSSNTVNDAENSVNDLTVDDDILNETEILQTDNNVTIIADEVHDLNKEKLVDLTMENAVIDLTDDETDDKKENDIICIKDDEKDCIYIDEDKKETIEQSDDDVILIEDTTPAYTIDDDDDDATTTYHQPSIFDMQQEINYIKSQLLPRYQINFEMEHRRLQFIKATRNSYFKRRRLAQNKNKSTNNIAVQTETEPAGTSKEGTNIKIEPDEIRYNVFKYDENLRKKLKQSIADIEDVKLKQENLSETTDPITQVCKIEPDTERRTEKRKSDAVIAESSQKKIIKSEPADTNNTDSNK